MIVYYNNNTTNYAFPYYIPYPKTLKVNFYYESPSRNK